MGKVAPAAGVQFTVVAPSTASFADVVNVTTVPAELVAFHVPFARTVKSGGVVSCTVTSKLLLAVLPATSVALKLTDVLPMGNTAPLELLMTVDAMPLTTSLAVALNVTVAPD